MTSRLDKYRFWAYAATFGAIWGIVELTLGTFLKTLRLPLSGSLLASCACALLVAQRQLFPRRGITLATGVVAAACKSISPDGTILGPMIGIMSEALAIEIALSLFGRSWLGAIVAGTLGALCPLSQKLLGDIAYYGGTILSLYIEIFRRAAQLIGATHEQMIGTGIAVLAIVISFGVMCAVIGLFIARRVDLGEASAALPISPVPAPSGSKFEEPVAFESTFFRRHKDKWIAVLAVVAVMVQFRRGLEYSFVALLIFLPGLALLRPKALKRMWRPRFWKISLAFAIISGVLLGPKDLPLPVLSGVRLSSTGLQAGIGMVVRGAFIFALTSWISVALDRRTFLRFAQKLGFGTFGNAITAAFGIMPELRPVFVEHFGRAFSRGGSWVQNGSRILAVAVSLAERSARHQLRPRVIALIGNRRSGKTTVLLKVSEACQKLGLRPGGICQPSADAESSAYDLLNIATGERRRFATRRPEGRGCIFDESGWDWARTSINQASKDSRIVFIDELGKLEAQGGGHLPALESLLNCDEISPIAIVLGVQEWASKTIEEKCGGFDHKIAIGEEHDPTEQVLTILKQVQSESVEYHNGFHCCPPVTVGLESSYSSGKRSHFNG